MTRPRILFVIGSLREGGAEGQLVHLIRGLRNRGWDVRLMLLRHEGARLQEVLDEGFEVFSVDLPRFRPLWNPLRWFAAAAALGRSWTYIRHTKPQVVHAWLYWAHIWSALLLLPAGLRGPVLVTSRRQTWSDRKGSPLLGLMEFAPNCMARKIVANAEAVKAACRRSVFDRPFMRKVRVIPNGVDIDRIDGYAEANIRHEFPRIADARIIAITVANLLPHKGYPVLLRAWRRIVAEEPDAALVCVGADGGIRDRLEMMVRRFGLGHRVVFAGSRSDVPALLKGADIAVHASLDEGMSNAVLEYIACGLATVATDVGGTREALQDGRAGILVPANDERALAREVVDLLRNPVRRRQLSEAGHRRAITRYPLGRMIDRHERLYRRLIH